LHERLGAAQLRAMLEVSVTRLDADQVFVRPHSVILAGEPWNAEAMRGSVTEAAAALWSHARLGMNWRGEELEGLGHIVLAVDGPLLLIGDSKELVDALMARRTRPAVTGATYAAGWRHGRELPNLERVMRLIDSPESRALGENHEPIFYSENMASIGRVLNRVREACITVHDAGPMLRESVVYRLNP
jgi:hypothetical protein